MSDIINIPAVENSTLLAQNQLLTAQNEILQAQTEQLTTIARNLTSLIVSGITLKGTIGTGGTVTALPSSHGKGDAYIVISAGTYAGASCAIGDVLVALGTSGTSASDWSRIAGFMASDGAAKYAIENYTGSSLLGTNQTIVSAFNALNSNIDITVTLISNSNYTLSVEGAHYKKGSCVTLCIAIAQSAQSSSYIKIGSIPSVYAPNGWIYMTVGISSDAMIGLSPTGEIYARGNFSRREYINLTYASK